MQRSTESRVRSGIGGGRNEMGQAMLWNKREGGIYPCNLFSFSGAKFLFFIGVSSHGLQRPPEPMVSKLSWKFLILMEIIKESANAILGLLHREISLTRVNVSLRLGVNSQRPEVQYFRGAWFKVTSSRIIEPRLIGDGENMREP